MARKRFGIQFKGFDEMFANYQKLGGDTKRIVGECLEAVPKLINPMLESDMAKHKRTGKTAQSISKDKPVEWSGTKAQIPVGFKLKEGGLPSIFLMYGTARHAPANQYGTYSGIVKGITQDQKLYNDIYGAATQRKVAEKQQEIFTREIKKIMGG